VEDGTVSAFRWSRQGSPDTGGGCPEKKFFLAGQRVRILDTREKQDFRLLAQAGCIFDHYYS
jgi:hypothetical protein